METSTGLGHNHLLVDPESCKRLILKGEMTERFKVHAWKAVRWSHVETYRSIFSAAPSTT
jgi:hypothetical protein